MTLFLVRHASAGSRSTWDGPGVDRPLDDDGIRDAAALAQGLAPCGITSTLSSPYLRCRQTVQPLAADLGLEVIDEEALTEGASPRSTVALLHDLARSDEHAVLCSHGDIIPATIRALQRDGLTVVGARGSKKGSVWVLQTRGADIVTGHYVRKPGQLGTVIGS